ncbi:hypothetical protein FA13DRAFT_1322387 [Coprinellus micaceus]|uniref:Uncharacterized protein n=1 Tax=Coprinellus micaceus TaxID=71717 RepID=A0A4Y7R4I4_COPMI|nr:hypothetical protein FA13DRAFT_1322387 [Coprinellus micaceus]
MPDRIFIMRALLGFVPCRSVIRNHSAFRPAPRSSRFVLAPVPSPSAQVRMHWEGFSRLRLRAGAELKKL